MSDFQSDPSSTSILMCANSEGSGETARMGTLAWAFAGHLCDKYHNLMSWQGYYMLSNQSHGYVCFDAILQEDVCYMLTYSLKVTMSLLQNRTFRNEILSVLTKLYMNLATPDYINVCQCYIFLDDAQSVSEVLEKLLKGDEVCKSLFLNFL